MLEQGKLTKNKSFNCTAELEKEGAMGSEDFPMCLQGRGD